MILRDLCAVMWAGRCRRMKRRHSKSGNTVLEGDLLRLRTECDSITFINNDVKALN